MNNKLNELMAEVMEWRIQRTDFDLATVWIDQDEKYIMDYADWNPTEDIAQAMMCAKQSGLELHIRIGDYYGIPFVVEEFSKEFDRGCQTIRETSLAICECIAEAIGGEG